MTLIGQLKEGGLYQAAGSISIHLEQVVWAYRTSVWPVWVIWPELGLIVALVNTKLDLYSEWLWLCYPLLYYLTVSLYFKKCLVLSS